MRRLGQNYSKYLKSMKRINNLEKTGERIIPKKYTNEEDYLIYLRHLFSYIYAKRIVSNNFKILEVGSGEGYGS